MNWGVGLSDCQPISACLARGLTRWQFRTIWAFCRCAQFDLSAGFALAVAIGLALALGVGLSTSARAQFAISTVPMLVSEPPPANIVFTIDDSGSMTYAYVPDYVSQYSDAAGFASSSYNSIYYNPAITYFTPPDANNNPVPSALCPLGCPLTSFTSAYYDGFNPDLGAIDLSSQYTVTLTMSYNGGGSPSVQVTPANAGTYGNPGHAYYYLFNPGTGCVTPAPKSQKPPEVRNRVNAKAALPASAVKGKLGSRFARATPMSALAACKFSSA